jgi:hypothetical protein
LLLEDMHYNMLQLDSILYKFFGPSKLSVIMSLKPYFQLIIRDGFMRSVKANLRIMLILWFKWPMHVGTHVSLQN